MQPVLAFPALEGMTFPRLEAQGLRRIVGVAEDIAGLDPAARAAVRVLMTSASRGCVAGWIDMLPNLGLVVSQGAGRDRIDAAALARRHIRLRCVSEAGSDDVADHAMGLTYMLLRNALRADAFVRRGDWGTHRFGLGDSLSGSTMGIAGLSGRIGQAVARRATAAGMRIAGLDRPSNRAFGAGLFPGWIALAEASDVLVLAVPGVPELRHVVDARVLAALGPGGRLVNVGRGALVDTAALTTALETGTIAGAALDVLEDEPAVPPRLAALDQVILTPHIAAQTWRQRAESARIAEDEILAFLQD